MEINQVMFDRIFDDPVRSDLDQAEMAVVSRFRDKWPVWDVLELGCGDGRVAYTISALAASYTGIDYAPAMVRKAKTRIDESDTVSFEEMDARDLPNEWAGRFDVVLFPFDGLDNVGYDDRLVVLDEARRVLADSGVFYFSCHSLNSMPFRWEWPKPNFFSLRSIADSIQMLSEDVMMKFRSRSADLDEATDRGWTILRGPGHFETFYTTPKYQIDQLDESGFDILEVIDTTGYTIEAPYDGVDESLHFICRR